MSPLVELKNDYIQILSGFLCIPIYQGISSIFEAAVEYKKKNPSTAVQELRVFQDLLKQVIPKWHPTTVEREVNRIRSVCKQGNVLDELYRAILKSSIMIQTNTTSFKNMIYVKRKHYEEASFDTFVHRCYILCAREFYTYPFLFSKAGDPSKIKNNQRESLTIINDCVRNAIRHSLPLQEMLAEFLDEGGNRHKTFNHTVSLLADDGSNVMDKIFSTYNIKESMPKLITNQNLSNIQEEGDKKDKKEDHIDFAETKPVSAQPSQEGGGSDEEQSNKIPTSRHSLTNFLLEDPMLIKSESIVQSPVDD